MDAIESAPIDVQVRAGLPRDQFVGLLKRVGASGGVFVGNSSAGLIESAALGCPSVDIGDRQSGRERCEGWTMHAKESVESIRDAMGRVLDPGIERSTHPYGDGTSGVQIADLIAKVLGHTTSRALTRKRCAF
jgi:UDP-N-acetylglucosamine 2-epimerase